MNGHQTVKHPAFSMPGREPSFSGAPPLFTHNRDGVPAPPGLAFNLIGQLVPLAYQPWMFGPQQAWESFYNPEYLAWGQSEASIEPQPSVDPALPSRWGKDPLGRAVPPLTHEHVALVPNYEYINREDPDQPTQDNGTLALTGIGTMGAVARINYRRSKSLISYTFVPSPDIEFALSINDPTKPTPLAAKPVQPTPDAPPFGGCVSIAQISIGHKGNQFDVYYDVPPGQIIHVPFGGSFGQTKSMLVPKYFHPAPGAGEPGTGFRTYLLFPGGPFLAQPPGIAGGSAIWNTMTQQALPENNFTDLTLANPNTVPFMGWFGEALGGFANIPETQARRRFYGTVKCGVVPPNPLANPPTIPESVTVNPVAFGSTVVTLIANPGLNFIIRGNTTFALYGPFPANTEITIPSNATSIIVFPIANLTQPGNPVIEEFYELAYDLSF